ncbi:MAG: ABC transporter permease [Dysgonamonadaceae bacterium]|jgi:ABC-2 type transport system permease protein|nr:ABC transporter permease [Dysgonamonadaceae bacterium]
MNTLALVIEREYISRVKKRSFIILTIAMPVLLVLLAFVPMWLSQLNDSGVKNIAIVDKTGLYASELKSTETYNFQVITAAQEDDYKKQIGGDIYGILTISNDLSKYPNSVNLLSEKQAPASLQSLIQNALNEKVTQQNLDNLSTQSNVSDQSIKEVRSIIEKGGNVTVSTLKWGKDEKASKTSTEMATIVGGAFTMLIYMFILMYGGMVMQAVQEEKKSRVVEVMVSSVKPVDLLIGKIVGVGLVGITQLVIWTVLTLVLFLGVSFVYNTPEQAQLMAQAGSMGMGDIDVNNIMESIVSLNWVEIIIYFFVFFIGGYILYASLFAAIAAAVDSEEDTNQFMMPITILIVFAFFAGIYSIDNPDGPLAFWTSLFPFTAPIVMMVRIPFGIPFWQLLLSLVLLYGTFILVSIAAAKIYRVGILMYGKKPTFKEMMKWMKYS